jgi:hypothetical protein
MHGKTSIKDGIASGREWTASCSKRVIWIVISGNKTKNDKNKRSNKRKEDKMCIIIRFGVQCETQHCLWWTRLVVIVVGAVDSICIMGRGFSQKFKLRSCFLYFPQQILNLFISFYNKIKKHESSRMTRTHGSSNNLGRVMLGGSKRNFFKF